MTLFIPGYLYAKIHEVKSIYISQDADYYGPFQWFRKVTHTLQIQYEQDDKQSHGNDFTVQISSENLEEIERHFKAVIDQIRDQGQDSYLLNKAAEDALLK